MAREDSSLGLQHRRWSDIPLQPGKEDAFTGGFPVATVAFVRDADGRIQAFLASNGRTRDVRFERQD